MLNDLYHFFAFFAFFHVSKFYLNIFIKMKGKNNILYDKNSLNCGFFSQTRQNATAFLRSVTTKKKKKKSFFPRNAYLSTVLFSAIFSWSKAFFLFLIMSSGSFSFFFQTWYVIQRVTFKECIESTLSMTLKQWFCVKKRFFFQFKL